MNLNYSLEDDDQFVITKKCNVKVTKSMCLDLRSDDGLATVISVPEHRAILIEEVSDDEDVPIYKLEEVLQLLGYEIVGKHVVARFHPFRACLKDLPKLGDVKYHNLVVQDIMFPSVGYELLTEKSNSLGSYSSLGVIAQNGISNVLIGMRIVEAVDFSITINVTLSNRNVKTYYWDDDGIQEISRDECYSFERNYDSSLVEVTGLLKEPKILNVGLSKFRCVPVEWINPVYFPSFDRPIEGIVLDINGCPYLSPTDIEVVLSVVDKRAYDAEGAFVTEAAFATDGPTLFNYNRKTSRYSVLDFSIRPVMSRQLINLHVNKVVLVEDLFEKFFFPKLPVQKQFPIPLERDYDAALRLWRTGSTILWFPMKPEKKSSSRNSEVSNYMFYQDVYDRYSFSRHLINKGLVYVGNNLVEKRTAYEGEGKVLDFGDCYYSGQQLSQEYKPIWCKRGQYDVSDHSAVRYDKVYLTYKKFKIK